MCRARFLILLLCFAPSVGRASDGSVALVATTRLEASAQVITLPAKVGLLRAAEERVLAAEVPGRIESLALPGQRVRAGEHQTSTTQGPGLGSSM